MDDEISYQLKEGAGSRHDVATMPQIASGFGQNRGILFFAEKQVIDRALGLCLGENLLETRVYIRVNKVSREGGEARAPLKKRE